MSAPTLPQDGEILAWFIDKWVQRYDDTEGDIEVVAHQMKKQGIPVEIAAAVLARAASGTFGYAQT